MNPDVVVIGAGAAGIGAGRALAHLDVTFQVIEAKDRIGGRTWSDTDSLGHLWDRGAHWFHSADHNPLRKLADTIGHRFRTQPPAPAFKTFLGGRWIGQSVRKDYVWELLRRIAEDGRAGNDRAAGALLDAAHPWNPMVRHWVALMYSVDPEEISTADAGNYHDTGINLAVEDGYGALLSRLAQGLPIKTNAAARALEVTATAVRVATDQGNLEARAAVLAVPARMIEQEKLKIVPALPESVAQAFADVPMGYYEKIALLFDAPLFESAGVPYADIFDPVTPETHPLNFELNPFGRPLAIAHIGGKLAREMEQTGEAQMIDFALATLSRAFGADIRRHFVKGKATHWSSDPFIGGAYSAARPGKANRRRHFLEPLHQRVFLAGEHTSLNNMATAHGAYASGIRAALLAARHAGSIATLPGAV